MRKPRDIDSELKMLADKARALRARKLVQLGELVTACGADTLPVETLAGALLQAGAMHDAATLEAWRTAGERWFRDKARSTSAKRGGAAPAAGAAPPPGTGTSAA
ncbi:conjugal transfer protein TraD [Sphingomonas sp. PL-96]|uniref:conjugal transfer protein TraD n=1 Tax=Sphingomonas sp. PL-96 TaxID=2887201 RepID=UPI001E46AEE1|nr:conjugal transfer protein TraD [Sphingomonas sp. PL-96]MCC2976647.1 conjugal transfer protein TraD [Sphingomonas sp. PL-96]